MDDLLTQLIRKRAGHRCEYCRIPRSVHPHFPFPIDHIIARQHGGKTVLNNLAYSGLHCNSHEGPNLAGIDPETNKLTKLFHPRLHSWSTHFRWKGATLMGRTAIGRTTVMVLKLNDVYLIDFRKGMIEDGMLFD